jgi:hypothetical protein
MPKILKEEVAKPIAEEVLLSIRTKHPELSDPQVRAVLNTAASLTTPFVKKVKVAEPVSEPATETPTA